MFQNGPRGNPAPPPRPSGISALSNLVSHAVAPVEHVAQVVQHSAPARAYIAAHSAPAPTHSAPTRSAPARSASGRFAPTTRLASAIAALTPAQRARIASDPQQTLQRLAQVLSNGNPWTRMFESPWGQYSPQGGLTGPNYQPDTAPTERLGPPTIPIPNFDRSGMSLSQLQRDLGFRSGSGNSSPGTRGLADRSVFRPPAMRA